MFAVLIVIASLHPVLDFLMGFGPPVPFLWPFVKRGWLSPVILIPIAPYLPYGFHVLAEAITWKSLLLEILIFVPLWLSVRTGWKFWSLVGMVTSMEAIAITVALYN